MPFDISDVGANATHMLHGEAVKTHKTPPYPLFIGTAAFLGGMAECYIAIFAMSYFCIVMFVPIFLEPFESHFESLSLILRFFFC